MPKLLLIVSFLLIQTYSIGQQDMPERSEGIRSFWFNPATVATYNKYSINTVYGRMRSEWDVVPSHWNISANFKVINYGSIFGKTEAKGALGLNARQENYGLFRYQYVSLPMNVQFNLRKTYLSVGVAPGIWRVSLNEDLISFPPEESDYPTTAFNLDLGLNWYNEKFNLGASVRNLIRSSSPYNYYYRPNLYVHGGYELSIRRKLFFKGIATLRSDFNYYSHAEILYINYQKVPVTIGAGLRDFNQPIFGIYSRFNLVMIGYFIEFSTNNLSSGNPFHEFKIAVELFDEAINNRANRRITPYF